MTPDKPKNPNGIWAYWKRLLDERVRTYVVIAIAALMVQFLAQIMGGSLLAGLVPFLLGLLAMGLGWSGMPLFCVIAVAWFQALPFGLPAGEPFPIPSSRTHFRITDIMLAGSVLVYLMAQYRVYSLAKRALPDERPATYIPLAETTDKRDPELIDESEIPRSFLAIAGLVLLGQLIWLVLNEVQLDFNRFPPLRPRQTVELPREPGTSASAMFTQVASRWVSFVLITGFTIFVVRLVLWYWRLRALTRDEARLIMVDTSWLEMRREAARQETWRMSGIAKAIPKVPKPLPIPKKKVPRKPWLGAAIQRGCLLAVIAGVVAVILVCAGVSIMDWLQSRKR